MKFRHLSQNRRCRWCCSQHAWCTCRSFRMAISSWPGRRGFLGSRHCWCCRCWSRSGIGQWRRSCRTSCGCWTAGFACQTGEHRTCQWTRFSLSSSRTKSSVHRWLQVQKDMKACQQRFLVVLCMDQCLRSLQKYFKIFVILWLKLTFNLLVSGVSVADFARRHRKCQWVRQLHLWRADQGLSFTSIEVCPFNFWVNSVPVGPENFAENFNF